MYKTIMVPIDLSHADKGAAMIDVAKNMNTTNDARIVLLNVVPELPTYMAEQLPKDVMADSRPVAQKQLQEIADKSGVKCEAITKIGHAYRTILATAEDEGADLIIIASHQPGIQDYFLGSTAARVVRHATCSVLVTR